jgi:tetratricopeptide (TPR) repeat protein
MSLLMQALKKAEQAKQKKNDLPVIEEQAEAAAFLPPQEEKKVALSLDIDDAHMLAVNKLAKESEQIEQNSLAMKKPSSMELSLTPHQDERIEGKAVETHNAQSESEEITSAIRSENNASEGNAGNTDSQFNKIEPSLIAPSDQIDSFLAHAPAQVIDVQNASKPLDSKAIASSDTSNNLNEKRADDGSEKESEKESEQEKKQIITPKIDAEQKQMIEQANKNRLLDQQKARAVFSSKTPANTLRLKWLSIVAIAILVVFIGFAYMLWQKSNANNNRFPVAPPLAAESAADIAPMPQEVDASGLNEVSPSAQVENAVGKTDQTISQEKVEGSKLSIDAKQSTGTRTSTSTNSSLSKNIQEKANKNTTNFPSQFSATPNNVSAMKNESSSVTATKKMNSKAANDANAIQILKGSVGAKINPNLVSAYQAYMAGDRVLATVEYQKVLQQEPNNRDALLGLAAIALNQRQAEQAGEYYARLLELDPNDADAIAGLTSLQQADPVQSESRLKAALNQTPSSGPILFALGNLYAQQSRWSDAQQTYFRAYANAPTNADYAFNLAISLDRLNQRKLAIEYYQRALNLTKTGPGNFNENKVQQRLTQLENIRDN